MCCIEGMLRDVCVGLECGPVLETWAEMPSRRRSGGRRTWSETGPMVDLVASLIREVRRASGRFSSMFILSTGIFRLSIFHFTQDRNLPEQIGRFFKRGIVMLLYGPSRSKSGDLPGKYPGGDSRLPKYGLNPTCTDGLARERLACIGGRNGRNWNFFFMPFGVNDGS